MSETQVVNIGRKLDPEKVAIVNARSGRTVLVPVGPHLNAGMGLAHYVNKRDNGSDKRLFFLLNEWEGMTDAERKSAMDFTVIETTAQKRNAAKVVEQIASLDAAGLRAVRGLLGIKDEPAAPAPGKKA